MLSWWAKFKMETKHYMCCNSKSFFNLAGDDVVSRVFQEQDSSKSPDYYVDGVKTMIAVSFKWCLRHANGKR